MKFFTILITAAIALCFLQSCEMGYIRKNGDWHWVTNDESNGKRSMVIAEADEKSFIVLERSQYAKDKNNVYFEGQKIEQANPNDLQFMGDEKSLYFKDNKHVFFQNEIILNADPSTFGVIEFPYSKDKTNIYCGTLPMMLTATEVATFKVTNTDQTMKGTISTMKAKHFIEFNKAYQWIDSLNIAYVITGDWGTAEADGKKFRGLYQVKTK